MGDVIIVYGDVDYDGFYRGELAGRRGLVPSNFLRPADAAPHPRHSHGPPSPLPPPTANTMPDEGSMARGPGLPDAPYGQPPAASPMPTGTSAGQQRRPGDVAQLTAVPGPPPAQPSSSVVPETRDLAMSASPVYTGGPETADDRLRRSGQAYRR